MLGCPFSPRTYSSTPVAHVARVLFSFIHETTLERVGKVAEEVMEGSAIGFPGLAPAHNGWLGECLSPWCAQPQGPLGFATKGLGQGVH